MQLRSPHTSVLEVSTILAVRPRIIGQLASDDGCPVLVLFGERTSTSTSSGVMMGTGAR